MTEFIGDLGFGVPSSILDPALRDALARKREKEGKRRQLNKASGKGATVLKANAAAWILTMQNHAKKLWSGNGEEKDYGNHRMARTLYFWLKAQAKTGNTNITKVPAIRTIEDNLTGLKKLAKRNT